MARSIYKGTFFPSVIYKLALTRVTPALVYARNLFIPEQFVEKSFKIYNGRTFKALDVSVLHLKQRFGEFAMTRAIYVPKKKKKAAMLRKQKQNKKK
jgi:ribosomal protein S19